MEGVTLLVIVAEESVCPVLTESCNWSHSASPHSARVETSPADGTWLLVFSTEHSQASCSNSSHLSNKVRSAE